MAPHDSAEGADQGATARPCGICALIERCRAGNFIDFVAVATEFRGRGIARALVTTLIPRSAIAARSA